MVGDLRSLLNSNWEFEFFPSDHQPWAFYFHGQTFLACFFPLRLNLYAKHIIFLVVLKMSML